MDLWIVSVAPSVGCLTMYWRNLMKDKGISNTSISEGFDNEISRSRSSILHTHEIVCTSYRSKWIEETCEDAAMKGEKVSEGRFSSDFELYGASAAEVASASEFDGDRLTCIDKYDDSNLHPSLISENCQNIAGINSGGHFDNISSRLLHEKSTTKMSFFYGYPRYTSSFRGIQSYMHVNRPLSSMESRPLSHLYKELTEKEYLINSLPSPSVSSVRPLFASGGSHMIGREFDHPLDTWNEADEDKLAKEVCIKTSENVFGILALPVFTPAEISGKAKLKEDMVLGRGLSVACEKVNNNHYHQLGDGMLLFCLGISIGLISAAIRNRSEVENLREELSHTENLVQDLQSELEMKDAFTVKELLHKDYCSQDTLDQSSFHNMEANTVFPAEDLDEVVKYDGEELYKQGVDKNSEHMRAIEAELEVELERLELSMTSSSLERKSSDFIELDVEFLAAAAGGELRADTVTGGTGAQSDSGQSTCDTSSVYTANYAVSPQELSLRLHEVIQLRLKERIGELEAALEGSQRRVRELEEKQMYSWREHSDGEPESSSGSEDHLLGNPRAKPLVLNLSADALDANKQGSFIWCS